MTSKERDDKIWEYFRLDIDLLSKKGHDYAGSTDALANLKRFGAFGIVVRLSDKFSRLEAYAKGGKLLVSDESVIDTLRDIRNYCFLLQIFIEGADQDHHYPTDSEDYYYLLCKKEK